LQDAGFENITLDLIYGYPLLTDEKWKANIQKVLDLEVPHISAYSMTVEPRTALASLINRGLQKVMDESQSASQFLVLTGSLQEAGFEQYEISNFARKGMYSKHNSNYWKGIYYLGVGPSAHSFNGESRQWNIANNAGYIESLNKNVIPAEQETLSAVNKLNEYIMTSLRTMWGMDLKKIEQEFGREYRSRVEDSMEGFLNKNHLTKQDDIIILTMEGKLFADKIASELFADEIR
jgi:oxygen-independent coproporphyrinogen-3 oxidase